MRSSKSRSRSKNNRSRSVGNIVNRVFDSSGPEGKVRGTPQQIIDKYNQLARDATLANDRVAAENFQQHAEHYTRLLSEAMREQEARREQQDQQNRERQREQNQKNAAPAPAPASDPASAPQPDLAESPAAPVEGEANAGLVETPESKPARTRKPRKPAPKKTNTPPADGADTPADAAE